MLSMLENKDGTRTIEMILKSTVLKIMLQIGVFKYKTRAYRMWDVIAITIASSNTRSSALVKLANTKNMYKI